MSEMTTAQALLTTDVPIVSVTQAAQVVQALYGLTTLVAAPRRTCSLASDAPTKTLSAR